MYGLPNAELIKVRGLRPFFGEQGAQTYAIISRVDLSKRHKTYALELKISDGTKFIYLTNPQKRRYFTRENLVWAIQTIRSRKFIEAMPTRLDQRGTA